MAHTYTGEEYFDYMLFSVNDERVHDTHTWMATGMIQHLFRYCCSVLRCVAVCCGAMQCVAVCYGVLQCAAVCCRGAAVVLQGCYSVL